MGVLSRAVGLLLALATFACGDDRAAPSDAGIDAAPYPAFALPEVPVLKGPGNAMASVRVVPVFFAGDALHDSLLDYWGKLAASDIWAQTVGEYGVGALTIASPVELGAPPTSASDSEIGAFLEDQLSGTHPEWGPSDTPTIERSVYFLYYPESTTLSLGAGTSCQRFFGYHSHWTAQTRPDQTAPRIAYVVMSRCPNYPSPPFNAVLEMLTAWGFHELVEAATDPYLDAWGTVVDATTLPWALIQGGEVADLCEAIPSSYYVPPEVGYKLQRSWSTAAAKAVEHPCVPHPSSNDPWFGAVPDMPDSFTVNIPVAVLANGVKLRVGETRTIGVHLFSGTAIPDPWTVMLYDTSPEHALHLELDRNTGQNGDTLMLTIRANAVPAAGFASVLLLSTRGARDAHWPLAVAVTP